LKLDATDLFVQVYRGGRAFYESADFVEQKERPAAQGSDVLRALLDRAHDRGIRIHAWVNVLSLSTRREARMILDLGPDSTAAIVAALGRARTLVWNGPLGAFEIPPFDRATVVAAQAAGKLTVAGSLLSVAGGGDTVAALAHAGVLEQFSYISTAGGAFLEWLEGKTLPGVEALENSPR